MTSQPASSVTLGPDRVFGPFDQDLAHRTAQRTSKPDEPSVLPITGRDASPSYCFWPAPLDSSP